MYCVYTLTQIFGCSIQVLQLGDRTALLQNPVEVIAFCDEEGIRCAWACSHLLNLSTWHPLEHPGTLGHPERGSSEGPRTL